MSTIKQSMKPLQKYSMHKFKMATCTIMRSQLRLQLKLADGVIQNNNLKTH